MDIEFLKTLIAVEENGSIAGAARAQGLTAAAASQRIKALEDQLQTPLFRRSGKTVRPSESCLRILPAVRKIIDAVDALPAQISKDGCQGVLRIGAIDTILSGAMPMALKKLRDIAPGLSPEIHPGTSLSLYEDLNNGRIDTALIIAPPFERPKHFTAPILRREKLCVFSPAGGPRDIIELSKTMPYIRYNPASWGGRLAEKFIKEKEIQPDVFCTIDALSTTLKMVSQGLGFSLLPDWLRHQSENFDAQCISIEDSRYARDIVCLHPRMSAKSTAIAAFKSALDLSLI